MGIKRSHLRSVGITSRIETLESRQLLSATLVEITIPTTTTPPAKHVVKKVVKPAVKHKAVKAAPKAGEQHANIGYEVFAG